MIISINGKKKSDKIQHSFVIKTLNKVGSEEIYLNIIQAMYDRTTPKIILNGKKLKDFSVRSGTRQGCPFLTLLFRTWYWKS